MLRIEVIEGPNAGKVFRVDPGDFIGSGDSADIRLVGKGILPGHIQVTRKNKRWLLHPRGRLGAVRVNDEFVESPRFLEAGDKIKIGEYLIEVQLVPDEPGAQESTKGSMTTTVRARQQFFANTGDVLNGFRDLKDSAERLGTLLKISNRLIGITEAEEVASQILDEIFSIIKADRGIVLCRDEQTGLLEPLATKRRVPDPEGEPIRGSKDIVRQVMDSKEGILTRDAQRDTRFDSGRTIELQNIHSAICVPLVSPGRDVFGVIHVDSSATRVRFNRDDLAFITGVAAQSSLALENARLIRRLAERKLQDQELKIANRVQMGLLPRKPPENADLEFSGTMVPAHVVGGDYYDFVPDPSHGRLYLCVGDVSGKGLGAGLVMVMARCFLRPMMQGIMSTRSIIESLNVLLGKDLPLGTFMTMLLMSWDEKDKSFTFTGAGHEPLLVYRAGTGTIEKIYGGGMALGLADLKRAVYEEKSLTLDSGDLVVLYSDGMTEARNEAGEMFGAKRLSEAIVGKASLPVAQMILDIMADVKVFVGNAPQHDDITLMVARRRA